MGRPRLDNVERHPSGQVVRDRPDAVALETRQRLFGIPAWEATQPEWSTYLGRLYKAGEIDRTQFNAGTAWVALRRDVAKEAGSKGLPAASDMDRGAGYDGREGDDAAYVTWAQGVRTRYRRCLQALDATGDPYAVWALEWGAVADKSVGMFLGSLRVGLNAIARVLT